MGRSTAPIALSMIVFSLAACGGGGGVNSTPAPTLNVTPPSPPPPPPPPPPSQFQSTSHASIGAEVMTNLLPDGTSAISGLEQVTSTRGPEVGTFEAIGPNHYAVEFYGWGGPTFPPSSLKGSNGKFDQYRINVQNGYQANLELLQNGTDIALTYSKFGNVAYGDGSGKDWEITFFAAGPNTPETQVPRTGSATFQGIADGLWIDGPSVRRLYGSPATMTANFATGELTSRLDLRGYDTPFGNFLSTTPVALGIFTGSGKINGSYFEGSYVPANGFSGPFFGQFFGPNANEAGWGFRLDGGGGRLVFGAAVAKQ